MEGAAYYRVKILRKYPRSGVELQPGAEVTLPASAIPGLTAVSPPFGRVIGPAGPTTAIVPAAAVARPDSAEDADETEMTGAEELAPEGDADG